jgi:outer membrane lipoprotein-sorting protein
MGAELRRAWLKGATLLCALLLAGPSLAFELAELMRTLAEVKQGEASFVERRSVAQLDQPLISSGRLSFSAPDNFLRETLKPRRELLSVSGNQLTLAQGSRSRTVALDATPEAQVIVEAIRGTLTGNLALLQRHFNTRLAGNAERWTLELQPIEPALRAQVAQIRVSGRQAELQEVQMNLADGDRSVMKIEPVMVSR